MQNQTACMWYLGIVQYYHKLEQRPHGLQEYLLVSLLVVKVPLTEKQVFVEYTQAQKKESSLETFLLSRLVLSLYPQ